MGGPRAGPTDALSAVEVQAEADAAAAAALAAAAAHASAATGVQQRARYEGGGASSSSAVSAKVGGVARTRPPARESMDPPLPHPRRLRRRWRESSSGCGSGATT